MSNKLVAGTIENNGQLTVGSMAEAIFKELNTHLPVHPSEDPAPRQWFAVAIAVGVIAHLRDNAQAFDVDVRDSGAPAITRTVAIHSDVVSP
jgi:hypothetical protein